MKKIVHDISTGEIRRVELTDEELDLREAIRLEAEQLESEIMGAPTIDELQMRIALLESIILDLMLGGEL